MKSNIIGAGKAENRKELDFYPTPREVTFALMDFLKLPKQIIYEPCCGTGDISKVLKLYGHEVISSDIRETGYGSGNIDYLNAFPSVANCIITNPPFNIADQIILKALTEADIVCMLLKSQYWHAKKRLKFFNDHTPRYVLPLTWRPDFSGGGSSMMDVAWSVWVKGVHNTIYQPLEKPDISFLF